MGQYAKHRPLVRLSLLLCLLFTSPIYADCRQALAIGLDVSGSVDAREYRLQLDGLAAALQQDDVRAALLTMPSAPVKLAVYEWSGAEDQHLVVDWTVIDGPKTLDQFIARLFGTKRTITAPPTAIGSSMLYGAFLLAQQPDCWRRTLDLSGDGPSNSGPRPRDVKTLSGLSQQITINALVVGNAQADAKTQNLTDYYRAEVITGPASFVEEAAGFEQFKEVMQRKLLRELQGLTLSDLRSKSR